MNEEQWLICKDPHVVLTFLQDENRLAERKCRLFAVACCRKIWHLLPPGSRAAIEVSELQAEGLVTAAEREAAAAGAVAAAVAADRGSRSPDAASYATAAAADCTSPYGGTFPPLLSVASTAANAAACSAAITSQRSITMRSMSRGGGESFTSSAA